MAELTFHDDPSAFLDDAGDHLAADPVVSTVVASVAQRAARGEVSRGVGPRWWLVAREGGQVTGVAMRSVPGAPYPLYVLPMPDDAAVSLARTLHGRGEEVLAVNGALPSARIVAEETARLTGRRARVDEHTRLHLLDDARRAGRRAGVGCAPPRWRTSTCAWPGSRPSSTTRRCRPAARAVTVRSSRRTPRR